MKNPLIVITGPTASGKTEMALKLAKEFNGEIVSADSMTIYRGMDIGTAKQKEWAGVPHHLLDIVDPDENFNVTDFVRLAKEKISEIVSRGKIPFLVGGSTMYIDALVYGYQFPSTRPDEDLRKALEKKSTEELFGELLSLDPKAEGIIEKNNKRRIIRALEVAIKTGKPFTEQQTKKPLPENVLYLAIEKERPRLYEDINKRVDIMMKEGFLAEVERLYKQYGEVSALNSAGYRQLLMYLKRETSEDEAIEKAKQAHRNYAKRQLTWLKKNFDVMWIKNLEDAKSKISKFFNSL